jgi:hypothetical protein
MNYRTSVVRIAITISKLIAACKVHLILSPGRKPKLFLGVAIKSQSVSNLKGMNNPFLLVQEGRQRPHRLREDETD